MFLSAAGNFYLGPTLAGPRDIADSRRAQSRTTWRRNWPLYFIVLGYLCQLALLIGAFAPFRIPIRVATFGLSLAFLFFRDKNRTKRHPTTRLAQAILIIITLSLAHPRLNTLTAGLAQVGLYTSILAPIFWVPRLQPDKHAMQKVLVAMWIFHAASSAVGVLQVEFPGHFQPALSTVYDSYGDFLNGLYITTGSGDQVFRPMGLTDTPGGAATSGFYVIAIGIGFFLLSQKAVIRCLSSTSIFVGLAAIYLSQVRSTLIIAVLSATIMCTLLFVQGFRRQVLLLAGTLIIVIAAGCSYVIGLGGDQALDRLATLTADSPGEVYRSNRGVFLQATVEDLMPKYPFGAGLGRWGMTNWYFGDNSDVDKEAIWAEIQLTGWLLDGGVPLILAYSSALLLAVWIALRIGWAQKSLRVWAAFIVAYDLGMIALTFDYPVFVSQTGMEFWFLNASLYSAFISCANRKRLLHV